MTIKNGYSMGYIASVYNVPKTWLNYWYTRGKLPERLKPLRVVWTSATVAVPQWNFSQMKGIVSLYKQEQLNKKG